MGLRRTVLADDGLSHLLKPCVEGIETPLLERLDFKFQLLKLGALAV